MPLKSKPLAPNQFSLGQLRKLKHDTPFFVISREVLEARYAQFRKLFPEAEICYAMKANSEEHVLKTLAAAGSSFEAASSYELDMLRRLRISPQRIISGTAVKPIAHIAEAYAYGVDRFAFDSAQELDHIASVAPESRVYVRMLVSDQDSVFRMSQKFGAPPEMVAPLLIDAAKRGLQPYGISFNVGSQASSASRWEVALRQVGKAMAELQAAGITIDAVNIGGGYPGNYVSSPRSVALTAIAAAVERGCGELPYPVKLIIEPGRGLVAEAAILVTSVIARIKRANRTWLYLDAGAYSALFESMVFQGTMRYHADVLAAEHTDAKLGRFVLTGPTGDGLDVISYDALLPQTVDVGDRIVFYHTGAYSLTLASPFNGFPRPAVYMI